jgi:hypothetical protein
MPSRDSCPTSLPLMVLGMRDVGGALASGTRWEVCSTWPTQSKEEDLSWTVRRFLGVPQAPSAEELEILSRHFAGYRRSCEAGGSGPVRNAEEIASEEERRRR